MRFLLTACLSLLTMVGSAVFSAEAALTPPTADEIATTAATVTGAVIKTPRGAIHVALFPKTAPVHVANFVKLARAKFYDGLAFHRVEPGFVIQGGDPFSRADLPADKQGPMGSGGPGYTIKLEVGPSNPEKHLPGTLAMADAGPDTAGSQFYLTQGQASFLDGRYTVFGRILAPEDLAVIRQVQRGDRFTVEIVTKP
jgi:peptidyl-prolyl cis-trans isomerase B (cyclophilin B)